MNLSVMNVLLWVCVIWLPALFYFLLANETKFKKNITLGVTLPHQAREDEDVLTILASFKKHLLIACLVPVLVAIPCIFIKRNGVAISIWSIWIVLAIIIPYIPYVTHHKKLKKLKVQRNWAHTQEHTKTVTLSANFSDKWLNPAVFLLPFLCSLIPLFVERELYVLYLIDAAMILLCWFGYRYLYRNKAETVDDNLLLTEALTRMRRKNWGKMWLICAWFLVALNFLCLFTQNNPTLALWGILLLSLVLMVVVISVEMGTRKLQESLSAESGESFYVDEDDKWIWGMFYYDPNDERVLINQRIGLNTTVNLARRAGQIFMLLTALLLACMPLLGVWVDKLERTPVALELKQDCIVAIHTGIEYELPLDRISYMEYVAEKPSLKREVGTGMDTVLKGKFSTPWGRAQICVDPRALPFLYLETDNGDRYLLGSSDSAQTEEIYQILLTKL